MSENCCDKKETTSCCEPKTSCCCTSALLTPYKKTDSWVIGEMSSSQGNVPIISTELGFRDKLGACKARWGIGRMDYKITPGIYAVGSPDGNSPVLVSANYKLTFDKLRVELKGLHCWLLILDTKGINVWCAAGKGTFGTKELIKRIRKTQLRHIITHKSIILPQLGAPGIDSTEVVKQTGMTVTYGPVRASDIRSFIHAGNKATKEMRTVKFTMRDRAVLTPMELVEASKVSLMVFGVLFLVNMLVARQFGLYDLLLYVAAVLTGTVLTPILLPFVPGRAFAFKGWLLGAIVTACLLWLGGWLTAPNWLLGVGYMLALPAYSAFLAMNFTGSSTYTSFSGVIKEMKIAVPLIIIGLLAGVVLLLIKGFIG